jgi:NAD(P)-dependent dehydrogenase (short-subunit alcohol dehydrogenase family)
LARELGAEAFPVDLSAAAALAPLVEEVRARVGSVEVLINNAGSAVTAPHARIPVAAIDRMVRVNLTAPLALTRLVLPGMLDRGWGRIISTASVAGRGFRDGRREQVDLIVYATGYRIHVPFLDPALLNGPEGRPGLWLHAFHPALDTLFAVGMIQTDSGLFGIVHEQARAVAGFLAMLQSDPGRSNAVERVRRARRAAMQGSDAELAGGIRYRPSARHHLEVEHWSYRRRLERLADSLAAGK